MNDSEFLRRFTLAYKRVICTSQRLSNFNARRIFSVRGKQAFPEAPGKECECPGCQQNRRIKQRTEHSESPWPYAGATKVTCLRCGCSWFKRIEGRPNICAICKRPNWDTPPVLKVAAQRKGTNNSRKPVSKEKATEMVKARWDAYYKAHPDKWIERQKKEAEKARHTGTRSAGS